VRIVVAGQGYVGLPLAVRAVECGHDVVGYDVDVTRVGRLSAGDSYVEDVPSATLRKALASGRYRATTDADAIAEFDVAVITVPTPLRDGVPDLSYVEQSTATIGRYLRRGATVVLESTTYPGTTQEVVGPILEKVSGLVAGIDFHLGFSPERIDPGNPVWNFTNTPKIVAGIDEPSRKAIKDFYDGLVETTVVVASPREAELAKLLENTFRHVNTWTSMCGRPSGRPRPSRSASCGSHPAPASAGTACPSIPRTCRGGWSASWVSRSASSSSPTTSTTTCPTTSCAAWPTR
jgi:UDP-N-acetyl-D-glucosamine dehydrogenase